LPLFSTFHIQIHIQEGSLNTVGLPRSIGWIALAIGVVILLATVFASDLGLGGTEYGIKHILGLIIGIVLVAGGLFVAMRPQPAGAK
jgi:hypothetical protein